MAIIISAFPCSGKSFYCNNLAKHFTTKDVKVAECNSDTFHWNEDGSLNKEFPKNYIQHVNELIHDNYSIIFVTSQIAVREALRDANLAYILVYPEHNMKDEIISRAKARGSSQAFVQSLSDNFEQWWNSCEEDNCAKFILRSRGSTLDDYSCLNEGVVNFIVEVVQNSCSMFNRPFHILSSIQDGFQNISFKFRFTPRDVEMLAIKDNKLTVDLSEEPEGLELKWDDEIDGPYAVAFLQLAAFNQYLDYCTRLPILEVVTEFLD